MPSLGRVGAEPGHRVAIVEGRLDELTASETTYPLDQVAPFTIIPGTGASSTAQRGLAFG